MKKLSHNTHHYSLDTNKANEMLQNILQSCEIEPNDIPLNQLLLRQKINQASLYFLRALAAFLFLLTLLAPLAIPRPNHTIAVDRKARILSGLNIVDYKVASDQLHFYLNTDIHVDKEASYLLSSDGTSYQISHSEVSSNINLITFDFPMDEADIYIYATNGKLLKIHFYPNKNS